MSAGDASSPKVPICIAQISINQYAQFNVLTTPICTAQCYNNTNMNNSVL